MFVLYRFETDRSGLILANEMNAPHGEVLPPEPTGTLFRWGTTRYAKQDERFARVINPAEAIIRAAQKIDSIPLLEKARVRVPSYSTSYKSLWDQGIREIVGQTAQHTEGRGFQYYRNLPPEMLDKVPTRDYYLEYIEGDEYRVIKVFNKYLLYRKTATRADANQHCRASQHGWKLYRVRPQTRLQDLKTQAFAACECLEIDIAGVDLRFRDGEAFVLEVNSAPRLNQKRAQFIKRHLPQ